MFLLRPSFQSAPQWEVTLGSLECILVLGLKTWGGKVGSGGAWA